MAIKEEVYFEGGPHYGDLIINTIVGSTIIGLPLFVGALVRRLWVRYRITNRRITVMGGWGGRDRSDIIYKEIAKIVSVPRGLGAWGDMVLTLKDGSRLELRSIPDFRTVQEYITTQMQGQSASASASSAHQAATGTSSSQTDAPVMDESDPSETVKPTFGEQAEQWNGRLAMVGFIGLIVLEWSTNSTLVEIIQSFFNL